MESTVVELDPIPSDIRIATRQIKKIHEANCLRKGIDLNLEIDESLPLVWIDVIRFNQVINNLVSNAIKFTWEGHVSLKISSTETTENEVTMTTEVIDTDIGLSDSQQDKIWQIFTQASASISRVYGGTGLGLPIVKSIVESMGSEIHIDSEEGLGSRFYFSLKLPIASEKVAVAPIKSKQHHLNKKRVLLVEDNEINVMVGKQVLENGGGGGVEVTVATNGQEAVDHNLADEFDAILMDIQMPVMDGYTATQEIRKTDKDTPIIALSASEFMEVKDKIFQSGMNRFVFKPFVPEDLLSQLDNTINGRVLALS